MDKKLEFNEALSSLIELAAGNGNSLTTEQIDAAFEGIIDNPDMLEHVYEYLVENKISITGYISPVSVSEESAETVPDEESATEQNYINMYLTELDDIIPLNDDEVIELIKNAADGDTPSMDKLVEINLRLVVELTENYKTKGVHTSDLIQEGNIGLISAIASYDGLPDINLFNEHLVKYINEALKNAVDEEIGADRIGQHLADRANALDNFSTAFAKEHEREATLEELAEGMGLPEDEVRNILKYSLDALNSTGEE